MALRDTEQFHVKPDDDSREIIKRLHEIIDLAKQMRDAQRDFFKTRNSEALVKSKQLERQFDEAVK